MCRRSYQKTPRPASTADPDARLNVQHGQREKTGATENLVDRAAFAFAWTSVTHSARHTSDPAVLGVRRDVGKVASDSSYSLQPEQKAIELPFRRHGENAILSDRSRAC